MDIVALQETRLAGSGSVRERHFSFFWQGKPPDETWEHGVGFAVRNTLLGSIIPPTEGTERILPLQLHSSTGPVSLISAYALTLSSTAEAKDKFYDDLSAAIEKILEHESLFILGDFNARVGSDHYSWPTCLGQFSKGRMNKNGQRLLELCCHKHLQTKPQHKVSWRQPRSKHWHQLDLILTRRGRLPSIQIRPRIDTNKTRVPEKVEEFARVLEESVPGLPDASAPKRWEHFRDTVYNAAMTTFGKKTCKSADWFEAHSEEMVPVIEEKQNALTAYKAFPTKRNLQVLRAACSKAQQCARQCANDYWLQLCSQIQLAADTGNIKGMYDGIKQALGPTQKKINPLKSATGEVIQERTQQMEHWVEHYSELYARENIVTEDALNAIECLPMLEELDAEPTPDELSKALDSLTTGKAPGKDGIPAEVLKCCKGDRSFCNNYRGISLLCIIGKMFARLILKRLQVLAERVYPESLWVQSQQVYHRYGVLDQATAGEMQITVATFLCRLH
ncbi:uncharacterized protein LOC134772317 [Penaeus indicus]|uniref:uncharacterized protein LOC134772317 n=1 Tax=Penaeus indicus TaxID=29960 RepID=UPI00300C0428